MPYGEEQKDFYDEQSMFSYAADSFKLDQFVFVLFCRNLLQISTLGFFPTDRCYYTLCYMK